MAIQAMCLGGIGIGRINLAYDPRGSFPEFILKTSKTIVTTLLTTYQSTTSSQG